MVIDMTQFELNKQLYEAVTDSPINLSRVENFLKLGADPLGSDDENEKEKHIIGDIFVDAEDNESLADCIEDVMNLLFKYGMDISSKLDEYDGNDNLNPLWDLAFNFSESGIRILKLLLDHNIDTESVEIMVEHILVDMCFLSGGLSVLEDWFYTHDIFSIKMIMLAASYSHIIDNSEYLRRKIWYDKNGFNTEKFRNWNDFDYHIDMTKCNDKTGYQDSVITIIEKATGKTVWTFGL